MIQVWDMKKAMKKVFTFWQEPFRAFEMFHQTANVLARTMICRVLGLFLQIFWQELKLKVPKVLAVSLGRFYKQQCSGENPELLSVWDISSNIKCSGHDLFCPCDKGLVKTSVKWI